MEILRKLLAGEIKARGRRNLIHARSFADLLEQALRRYQNRAIETAQVIEELIALAKEIRQASARGEQLGLSDDELAFYDAPRPTTASSLCSASRSSWRSHAS